MCDDNIVGKKGISPVVATALLLVVAVVAAVGFQSWYVDFQSSLFTDLEIQGNSALGGGLKIEGFVGESLYVSNNLKNNLSINKLRIDGNECILSENLSLGMNEINISSCINSSDGLVNIVLVSENKVVEKQLYVDSSSFNSNLAGEGSEESSLPSDPSCYLIGNVGTVGSWPGCDGMLIVDKSMLEDARDNYRISGGVDYYLEVGGNNYTFNDSTYNVFTGQVTSMSDLFSWESDFNADISYWETNNVNYMSSMFSGASSFNQPLNWSTGKVISMSDMFSYATSFNQILNFDTSQATEMVSMFYGATNFDQPLNFNTSKVSSMAYMFGYTMNFNQALTSFDTSELIDAQYMFDNAADFNQPLTSFDTTKVEYMDYMFRNASSFNQDLSSWCVVLISPEPTDFAIDSGIIEANEPTWGACVVPFSSYNLADFSIDGQGRINCENANINDIGNYSGELYFALGNDLVSSVVNNGVIIYGSQNITLNTTNVCTSKVTDMNRMFYGATSFNQPLTSFDTSNVIYMDAMFSGAESFNQALNFNTSQVIDLGRMFYGATDFNQSLNFDTSQVRYMGWMFYDATNFNQLLNFNTSNVYSFKNMFDRATNFNQLLSFDTRNITDLRNMFSSALNFDQPLNFNTSKVIYTNSMFAGADSFNQPLNWDTSQVTEMDYMFSFATDFNQSLNWDTSKVTQMYRMFYDAESLNRPLNFNTSQVTNMGYMFSGATIFNQDLSGWCVTNIPSLPSNFDTGSALTVPNRPSWTNCP